MVDKAAVRGMEPGKTPALIIRECQNFALREWALDPAMTDQIESRGTIGKIAALAAAFRAAGRLVVHQPFQPPAGFRGVPINSPLLSMARKTGVFEFGARSTEIVAELAPQAEDIVLPIRSGLLGFGSTPLAGYLRTLGIQTVVVAGISVNIGIVATTMGAVEAGFNVVIAEDCTAAASAEAQTMLVKHCLRTLATISDSASISQALRQGE